MSEVCSAKAPTASPIAAAMAPAQTSPTTPAAPPRELTVSPSCVFTVSPKRDVKVSPIREPIVPARTVPGATRPSEPITFEARPGVLGFGGIAPGASPRREIGRAPHVSSGAGVWPREASASGGRAEPSAAKRTCFGASLRASRRSHESGRRRRNSRRGVRQPLSASSRSLEGMKFPSFMFSEVAPKSWLLRPLSRRRPLSSISWRLWLSAKPMDSSPPRRIEGRGPLGACGGSGGCGPLDADAEEIGILIERREGDA
mmetsp:Transcript_17896/g.39289  ORF Transcript_17896/g.39289 Transcript_17896/m.39289 type:complete len:258 (-) Transcript_17896:1166-1939(-)